LHDSASYTTAARVVASTAHRRFDIGGDGLPLELDCQCVSLGASWATPLGQSTEVWWPDDADSCKSRMDGIP